MKASYLLLLILTVHFGVDASAGLKDAGKRFSKNVPAGQGCALVTTAMLLDSGGFSHVGLDDVGTSIVRRTRSTAVSHVSSEHESVELNLAAQAGDLQAAQKILEGGGLSARALRRAMLFGYQEYSYLVDESFRVVGDPVRVVDAIRQSLLVRQQ